MKRSLFLMLIIGIFLISEMSYAQLKTYNFEQIDSLQHIEKRKIIILIHTDWCKFCQAMKNTTLKNKEVINLLNNNFYFIELNAEEKKTIIYKGKNFDYKPTGNQTGTHELAIELGTINGLISYPTLCFLNDENEIILQKSGFISGKDLLIQCAKF